MPLYEIATTAERMPDGLIRVRATANIRSIPGGCDTMQIYEINARNVRHAKDKAKAMRFEQEKAKH